MSNIENNTGWRAILTHGVIYKLVQFMFSEKKSKQLILDEFISPAGHNCVVLDMGFGLGNLRPYLPESVNYIGFDISKDYIDQANRKYVKSANNTRFLCGTANQFIEVS